MAGAASAKRFLRACAQFAKDIGDLAARTKNALKAVQQAVESDFGIEAREPKGHAASEKRLIGKVQYRTRQLATLKRTLAECAARRRAATSTQRPSSGWGSRIPQ
jgi:hypothetical protein